MSSELDGVKAQVQQAVRGVDDAFFAVQEACSRVDDKLERLRALGVHASYEGLDLAGEKLREAMGALASGHDAASRAVTVVGEVEATMPLGECLPKLDAAVSSLGVCRIGLDGVAELVREARADAELVGVSGIVAVCHDAVEMLDIATATTDTAANAVSAYRGRLAREAEDVGGTGPAVPTGGSPSNATPPAMPDTRRPTAPDDGFTPAGVWRFSPSERRYDSPNKKDDPTFNEDYERWVQRIHDGPQDGREYAVAGPNGKTRYFDATRTETRDGKTVEVLIDAKGRYDQFTDNNRPGFFQGWWEDSEKSGLRAELRKARGQVAAANGRTVEWWCAEPNSARAFNNAMERNHELQGRARAIYKPMPTREQ